MPVKILSFSKRHFILLFVFLSILLHLVFGFCCSFYIETTSSPSVYAWTNIIEPEYLFFEKKPINLPLEAFSSSNLLHREYFSASLPAIGPSYKGQASILPYTKKVFFDEAYPSQKPQHIRLWERKAVWPLSPEKKISYRVYVSDRGRVIFLYPEKLSVNSYENLNFQDYVRESVLFLGDKFFWTKIEAVVK